jgi:GAF domain-containing protein
MPAVDLHSGEAVWRKSTVQRRSERPDHLYLKDMGELSLVGRLTESISLDLDIEQACQYPLNILLDELNIGNGSIMFLDEQKGEFVHKTAKGREDHQASFYDGNRVFGGVSLKEGEGIAGTVFRERKPLLITDVEADGRLRKDSKQTV